ncbi:hypothetical protein L8949_41380, partial [Paraburkholderia caribensis]|nr:hypothetical protein [Paraburkholderia caribensis]
DARRTGVALAAPAARQPSDPVVQPYNRRFAGNGKRMRRVGIVALARRLAIALRLYLEHG